MRAEWLRYFIFEKTPRNHSKDIWCSARLKEDFHSSNLHIYVHIFIESCSGTTESTTGADVSFIITSDINTTVSSPNASLIAQTTPPQEEASTTLTTEETTLNTTVDDAILTTTGMYIILVII